MTYDDIKLATLQKMFHDVTTTAETVVTKPYLDKMAFVCNCALQRLATYGNVTGKTFTITQIEHKNLLENDNYIYRFITSDEMVTYKTSGGKSYYLELNGECDVSIKVKNGETINIHNTLCTHFTVYKGLINNINSDEITLTFSSQTPFIFRNIAIYANTFPTVDLISPVRKYMMYDFNEIVSDFYKFDSNNRVICDPNINAKYEFINDSIFMIQGNITGSWDIPYIAYPQIITATTQGTTKILLPDFLCNIIVYYMASELYLEDDSALCVNWRNIFEKELGDYMISKRIRPMNKIEFVSLAGEADGIV